MAWNWLSRFLGKKKRGLGFRERIERLSQESHVDATKQIVVIQKNISNPVLTLICLGCVAVGIVIGALYPVMRSGSDGALHKTAETPKAVVPVKTEVVVKTSTPPSPAETKEVVKPEPLPPPKKADTVEVKANELEAIKRRNEALREKVAKIR